MRLKILSTLVAAMIPVASAHADQNCHSTKCRERVARKKCSQRNPRWCIERVIIARRLSGWASAWMRRIPSCESGWNPYAYFSHPNNRSPQTATVKRSNISAGLYEFKPTTWSSTPYGSKSIWSATWQAFAAAWMVRQGRTGEWVCN
jgi:hypothetical protein